MNFEVPLLWVVDGGKGINSAIGQLAGQAAFIQRCQFHKTENVMRHLPEGYSHSVRARMEAAYGMVDYGEAKQALHRLSRELEQRNPSAAESLLEGMEQTLTVHQLRVPPMLRKSLRTTNLIESGFSVVEDICNNVKHWQDGDHRLRWVASGLLFAENRFNRLHGHAQIPLLLAELELAAVRRGVSIRQAAQIA